MILTVILFLNLSTQRIDFDDLRYWYCRSDGECVQTWVIDKVVKVDYVTKL